MTKFNKILHIALTGHRPNKLGGYDITNKGYIKLQKDLELFIEARLKDYDVVIGHSGLALGADTIWSKAILSMRGKYPSRVKLHAEIPMMSQASVWFNKMDIDFWYLQVERADYKTVYGDLSKHPKDKEKYMVIKFLDDRNRGMIEHSDELLAVWDGSSGGTGNAVAYGKKIGIEIYIVNPKNYF